MKLTLKQLRENWEKGNTRFFEFQQDGTLLFVILEFDGVYRLLRYFFIGDMWRVSTDHASTLTGCLTTMSELMKEFVYPINS